MKDYLTKLADQLEADLDDEKIMPKTMNEIAMATKYQCGIVDVGDVIELEKVMETVDEVFND